MQSVQADTEVSLKIPKSLDNLAENPAPTVTHNVPHQLPTLISSLHYLAQN